jgi:nitroreductase
MPSALDVIRRRRAVRRYLLGQLDPGDLRTIVEAAIRAPSGEGLRPCVFVLVESATQLRRLITVSPGIFGAPAAILAICIDWSRAPHLAVDDNRDTHPTYFDVGAAMENALLAADALGLGACPVTSFHRPSVKTILELPATWTPCVLVTLGRRASPPGRPSPIPLNELLYADRYPERSDGASPTR